MDIVKIALLSCVIVFAITFTKQIKPEIAVLITIAGSVIMLIYVLGYFNNIVVFYNKLVLSTGVDQKYFTILLKAIGIGYLVEFASGVCRDSGNSSIADKVVFAGKLAILSLAVPIIESIFTLISGIL